MNTGANRSSKEYAGNDQIRLFLGSVMNKYMYGQMTAEEFCAAVKQYYDEHVLSVWEDDDLKMLIDQMLPKLVSALEARVISVDFPETEKRKKIEAWILFKDCKKLLEGGELFSKERERFFETGEGRGDDSEYTDRYLLYEREMEILVRAEAGVGGYLGYCHLYWICKEKVLREIFGIEWRSPAVRYPGVIFD